MNEKYVSKFQIDENDDIKIPWSLHNRPYNKIARLYVDGINGNDENDGLTPSTAFASLDRFFKEAEYVRADIRCFILSAGVYPVNGWTYTAIAVHITSAVDGVTIDFMGDEGTVAFYDCHINLSGNYTDPTSGVSSIHPLTIICGRTLGDNSGELYSDSGSIVFQNCIINTEYRSYGCSVDCRQTIIRRLVCNMAVAKFELCTFGNLNKGATILGRGAFIAIYGSSSMENLTSNINYPFIELQSCVLSLDSSLTLGSSYKYSIGMKINGCHVISSVPRLRAIQNLAVTYIDGDNNVIANNPLYSGEDISSDSAIALTDSVGNYNVISLRVTGSGVAGFRVIDIWNANNNTPPTTVVTIGGGSATVTLSGKTVTFSNVTGGFKCSYIFGRNI